MVSSILAANPDEAASHAAEFIGAGLPVALKILSQDIQHKSDIGGVRLNLTTATAVRSAAAEILNRVRTIRPEARIAGVIVQPMIVRPQARELIAGFADDPTFGPVIVFGRGGTAVEVIDDKALARSISSSPAISLRAPEFRAASRPTATSPLQTSPRLPCFSSSFLSSRPTFQRSAS